MARERLWQFLVHIMTQEARDFYALDKIFSFGEGVDFTKPVQKKTVAKKTAPRKATKTTKTAAKKVTPKTTTKKTAAKKTTKKSTQKTKKK